MSTVGIWGLGFNGQTAKKRSRRAEQLRRNKRQKRADGNKEGFDLPPSDKDEFDLNDLVGSVRKQKLSNPMKVTAESSADDHLNFDRIAVDGVVASIPKSDKDEKKFASILKLDKQFKKESEKKETIKHTRMEGESKRAYAKRTKTETREIIKRSTEVNHEKRQKKKEFLNQKKKNRKKGGPTSTSYHERNIPRDDGFEDNVPTTGEKDFAVTDQVRFGEVVERPPIFRQLPRGATPKDAKPEQKQTKGMTEEAVRAEKDAMELLRRKVHAQYAVIKTKRRRAGDFHL